MKRHLYVSSIAVIAVCLGLVLLYSGRKQKADESTEGAAGGAASGVQVNVTFRGLVAFVPDNTDLAQATAITALLPRAVADDKMGKIRRQEDPLPPHIAVVAVSTKNLKNPSTIGRWLSRGPNPADPAEKIYFALYSQNPLDPHTSYPNSPDDPDGYELGFEPPIQDTSGPFTLVDFKSYIPRLYNITPMNVHAKVCQNCLAGFTSNLWETLSGRMHFKSGTLTATELAKPNGTQVSTWAYAQYVPSQINPIPLTIPRIPGVAQAVTTQLIYKPDPSKPLNLVLTSLGGGTPQKYELQLAPNEPSIEIAVLNQPASDLFNMPDNRLRDPRQIEHFNLFYLLSDDLSTAAGSYIFPFKPMPPPPAGAKPWCTHALLDP